MQVAKTSNSAASHLGVEGGGLIERGVLTCITRPDFKGGGGIREGGGGGSIEKVAKKKSKHTIK